MEANSSLYFLHKQESYINFVYSNEAYIGLSVILAKQSENLKQQYGYTTQPQQNFNFPSKIKIKLSQV